MPGTNAGLKGLPAGAAVEKHLRVKLLSSGQFLTAGHADMELGTVTQAAFAAGDIRSVCLRNVKGTRLMVANAALALGDNVFTADAGKVGPPIAGAFRVGIALSVATADGDYIEVATDPGKIGYVPPP